METTAQPYPSSENNKNNAEIYHSSLLHRYHPTKEQEDKNFSVSDKKIYREVAREGLEPSTS